MKNKRITMTVFGLVLSLILGGFIYYSQVVYCKPDGKSVCYDKESGQFLIEDEARITVQVPTEEVGMELISTWNAIHPTHSGQVTYHVQDPLSVQDMILDFPTDIMMTSQKDAVYFMDRFYDFKGPLENLMSERIPRQFEENINIKGYKFIANSLSGPLFIYNDELGKSMGYEMSDNGFELPEKLSSFESILENESQILEVIDVSYPLTFKDQLMIYPLLTGGRWSLNFSRNPDNIGFDTSEFKKGLGLISMMSEMKLDKRLPENYQASDLPWQYETAYFNNESLMSFVYDVEFVQEHSGNMKFTPFPKYDQNPLSPIAEVFGYVVDGETSSPSAAAEVLRMLRSPDVLKTFPNTNVRTLIYDYEYLEEIEREDLDRIYAYRYHRPESLLTLTYNSSILARDVYYDIDIMPYLEALFDGKQSIEETQKKIVALADAWYESHKIEDVE